MKGYTCVGPDANSMLVPQGTPKRLNVHLDPRGGLFELFRESWGDGPIRQAYISITSPDVVKGWHLHKRQTDRFICVRGRVIVAMCDLSDRCGGMPKPFAEGPRVVEHVLDASLRPARLDVPPGWAHGWYNPGPDEAWILNLTSELYTGLDEWRRPADAGPCEGVEYDWRQGRDG